MNKLQIKLFTHFNVTGFIIAFMAGWVDTVSVLVMLNERSSSMSGRFSKAGRLLAQGETEQGLAIVTIILMFLLGCIISTIITKKLGLLGGLSVAVIFLMITPFTRLITGYNFALITLPLATGSINSATYVANLGRTTHMTGTLTDVGISLVNRNWDGATQGVIRFTAFFLGIFISYKVIGIYDKSMISLTTLFLIPSITIILTGVFSRLVIGNEFQKKKRQPKTSV